MREPSAYLAADQALIEVRNAMDRAVSVSQEYVADKPTYDTLVYHMDILRDQLEHARSELRRQHAAPTPSESPSGESSESIN